MNQNNFSKWLKIIIIGIGLCGVVVYLILLPFWGKSVFLAMPEFTHCYWPWLILFWITGVPCYAALFLGWKISTEIGRDNSFSMENAVSMKKISMLAIFDTLIFFIGNITFLILNISHPGILLISLILDSFGIAVAVTALVVSHLIYKAAKLQEDTQFTI